MADNQMIVASEVIVPELELSEATSPSLTSKRRQSFASDGSKKRARLSQDGVDYSRPAPTGLPLEAPSRSSDRLASGQIEERKRGKRLFGALLGTLAQNSSSTAHKRRVDIERKQQEKLKLQNEEYDEMKKRRLDALMESRRRAQKKYDKQSMQIRHANLLATANFLRTRSEPRLYYKPWKLLPGDETKIKLQIREAEDVIDKELLQVKDTDEGTENGGSNGRILADLPESTTDHQMPDGPTTDIAAAVEPLPETDTNPKPESPVQAKNADADGSESAKDLVDDGGEVVVEGEEDTVIY